MFFSFHKWSSLWSITSRMCVYVLYVHMCVYTTLWNIESHASKTCFLNFWFTCIVSRASCEATHACCGTWSGMRLEALCPELAYWCTNILVSRWVEGFQGVVVKQIVKHTCLLWNADPHTWRSHSGLEDRIILMCRCSLFWFLLRFRATQLWAQSGLLAPRTIKGTMHRLNSFHTHWKWLPLSSGGFVVGASSTVLVFLTT